MGFRVNFGRKSTLYYTLSDMALLGGSLEAWGGQYLIEPAALQQAKSAALAFGANHGGAAERTVQALTQLAAVLRD